MNAAIEALVINCGDTMERKRLAIGREELSGNRDGIEEKYRTMTRRMIF